MNYLDYLFFRMYNFFIKKGEKTGITFAVVIRIVGLFALQLTIFIYPLYRYYNDEPLQMKYKLLYSFFVVFLIAIPLFWFYYKKDRYKTIIDYFSHNIDFSQYKKYFKIHMTIICVEILYYVLMIKLIK